jgi:hypothetical protein
MEHPEKILGVSFISNDQPAEVLQPEAEDVGGFGFEQGIVAGQVAFETVWFQAGFLPYAMHGVFDVSGGRANSALAAS